MTQVAESKPDRASRKFAARREQLALAALETLGELGFARTSLREIAQKTQSSHGVLHYYFRDKSELIISSVRLYKEACLTRYDDLVATSASAEEFVDGFADTMVQTLTDEGAMHRLWYNLRTQAFFEDDLRRTVMELDSRLEEMIWRVLSRYSELSGAQVITTPAQAYALFDGVFEHALIRVVQGEAPEATGLREQVRSLMRLLAPAPAPAPAPA